MTATSQRIVTAVERSRLGHRLDLAVTSATRDLVPGPTSGWRGQWLGHALHPVLTDLPLGCFTSTTLLDLVGGRRSHGASALLLGMGLAASAPTVASGFADWSELDGPDRRVGVAHGAGNVVGLGLFAASLLARGARMHRTGVRLALAGNAFTAAAGYLGGHLTMNRGAASRMEATLPEERAQRIHSV